MRLRRPRPHLNSVALAFVQALALTFVTAAGLVGCGDNLTPLPDSQPYGDPGVPTLECVPNLDGRIDSSELQPAVGVPVRYRVTPFGQSRPVDLEGIVDAAGARRWSYVSDVELDAEISLSAESMAGKWFASEFPSDTVAVPSDVLQRTYGVYRHDSSGFYLLGVASAAEAPSEGKTLLKYDKPIELYRFPLEVGMEWTSVGTITNGTLYGLPYAGKDTYVMRVTTAGELLLPDFLFEQVLQVRARVTLQPAVGVSVVQQQAYFLFECFGEVVRATAADGNTDDPFQDAVEVRRLAL